MHSTTTGKYIFEEVSKCVNEMKLPWDKLTGLTTKERISGEDAGEDAGELTVYHCIIHQETLCGKALKMERHKHRNTYS